MRRFFESVCSMQSRAKREPAQQGGRGTSGNALASRARNSRAVSSKCSCSNSQPPVALRQLRDDEQVGLPPAFPSAHLIEQRPHEGVEDIACSAAGRNARKPLAAHDGQDVRTPRDGLDEQVLLRAEMIARQCERHGGLVGDVAQRNGVEGALSKQFFRGVENALARRVAVRARRGARRLRLARGGNSESGVWADLGLGIGSQFFLHERSR